MFHFHIYENESLYGLVYTFPNIGDGIARHDHTESQKHNIIILHGSLDVYGDGWSYTLKAGDVFDMMDEHHPHEIYALEPETRCLSLFVNGKPEGEVLADDERSGSIIGKSPLKRTPSSQNNA